MSGKKHPNTESVDVSEAPKPPSTSPLKKTADGRIVLLPQPTDDLRDPLNWPWWKKYSIFGVLCLAAFLSLASALAHLSAFVIQAKVYRKTPTELSYTASATIAGLMAGSFLCVSISKVFGISSALLWSLVGSCVCSVWSAEMTDAHDYIPFLISRLLNGIFAGFLQVLGTQLIIQIFFLHQRGKAFAIYTTCFTLGPIAGATFGGFIDYHTEWPVQHWWCVGALAFTAILCFFISEDGTYNRDGSVDPRVKDRRFIANRIATFLPGNKVVLGGSVEDFAKALVSPFTIILCPATILCGTFSMINFGWGIAVTNLLSIFLQSPYPAGYGFNPQQNAGFLFALWMGAFAAQTWGILVNDRLPLWIAKQRGGHWRPEYRLHSLWFPGLFILPVGLGIFGVALQYHLHYMVLALGAFLSIFGSNSVMTVPINYLVETFPQNPQEVGTAMNLWRNAISVSVQFFISPWTKAVGIGWVFGMMAFFSVFAFMLIIILMMFGPRIRMVRLGHVGNSEEEKEIEEK